MNRIFNLHHQRNADSSGRWECFANHRRKVTKLLVAADAGGRGRLCVLGAGNCNDLDLSELTRVYSEVHLVDLDKEAVNRGVRSQGLTDSSRVDVHGGIDLAGCNEIVSEWTPTRSPTDADLQHCVESMASHPAPRVAEPFDVVASVCLLTQLIDSISMSLGSEHPRFIELVTCLRLRHIRLLFELSKPRGAAILITDFVSSGTYPALETTPESDLPVLAAQLISARNFFTGTNPAVLHALFMTDPAVAPQVGQLEVSRPWLWDFGPRIYAVCAICAGKRASD